MKATHPVLKHRTLAYIAHLALVMVAAGWNPLYAANKVWDGGGADNFWQTPRNWDADTAPSVGDTLIFTSATRLNNTNDFPAGTLFNGISFNTPPAVGTFILGGNSITLGGDISDNQVVTLETINLPLVLSATRSVSVVSNGSLTLAGAISGPTFGLTKNGGGLLTLSAANTFGGPITVNAGALFVSSDTHLGAAPIAATPGNIVLNGGTLRTTSTFTINTNRGIALGPSSGTGSGTIDSSLVLTYGGVMANNGTGVGGLTKLSFGNLILSGANTYAGPTLIQNGTITLDFTQPASPLNDVVNSASPLTLGGATSGTGTTNFSALTLNGKPSISNTQTFNGTIIDIGSQVVRANSGAGGTANLILGQLIPLPGGDVTFVPPTVTGGAGNITTTTTNLNGILGGWAVIGDGSQLNGMTIGTNWASVDANSNIVNFAGHVVYSTAWGKINGHVTASDNLMIDDAGSGGPTATVAFDSDGAGSLTELNTINIRKSGTWTLRVGSNNVVRLGKYGSIFKSDTSAHVWSMGQGDNGADVADSQDSTGTLTAGGANNAAGVIVFNLNQSSQANANHHNCYARITDNGIGKVTVVKAGSAPFKLGGHNTYSGGTYMIQGRIQLGGGFIGTGNPDGFGTGPVYVFPGAYLYLNPGSGQFTNALFIAGNGTQPEPLGAIRFQSAGWDITSTVTLIGDATIGGNQGLISGKVTGPFSLTLGSGATVQGSTSLSNPNNDWTGNTFLQARSGQSGTFINGRNNVIPNGFGYGNVTMLGIGNITWNLNGFNETLNGLSTSGNGAACVILNNGASSSTLTIGDNDQSGTFAGSIQDGTASVALTKIGGGQEIFSGPNSYTGPTTISGGTLSIGGAGTMASPEIVVNNGGTFDVSGLAGDFLAPSAVRANSGTLLQNPVTMIVPTLALTNSSLTLVADTGKTNIVVTSLVTGGVTNRINITSVAGVLGYPAFFTIFKYTGSLGGAGMNFGFGDVPNTNTVGYISNDVASARVVLVLLDGPKPLTWTGNNLINPTLWDNGTTTNWLAFKGGAQEAPSRFTKGDSTLFDDTSSTNNVSLVSVLAPGGVTVSNETVNYLFSGGGALSGLSGILKQGAATLTLANTGSSDFRGGVRVNTGRVIFATDNSGAAGGVAVSPGASAQIGTNGPTGGFPAGIIASEGELLFNRTNDYTVANVIAGSSAGTLTKNNTGVLTLSGANTFTGAVTIAQGILKAGSGSALGRPDGFTTVNSGATLDVGGQTLTGEPVIVSGAGVNNNGAIINSGADNINALGDVSLSNHTAFGGSGRWDIRGGAASLSTGGAAYNLTKVGNNQFSLVGVTVDPALADITVSNGIFSVETTTTSLGNAANNFTVYSGGTLQFFATSIPWDKHFAFYGNGVSNIVNNSSGANIVSGPAVLNGQVVMTAGGTSLTFNGAVSGTGGLTKNGTSVLLLEGPSSYSGNTIVNAGALVLNGMNTGGGTLSNAPNSILGGHGTNTGPVILGANATFYVGGTNVAGPFGTGNLTMTNALLSFDLGVSDYNATFPANDKVFSTGNLVLNGTNRFTILTGPVGTITNNQVITLIQYAGTLTGASNNVTLIQPAGYVFTLLDPTTTPGAIQIRVDAAPSILAWRGLQGANSTAWDVRITPNWTNYTTGAAASTFTNFDAVIFDDLAGTNFAALVGTIVPASITLNNNSLNHTIGGTGKLSGNGSLSMFGTGRLVIANAGSNDFTGPVNINNGVLQIGDGSANGNLGSGAVTNNGALIFSRSGSLIVNNVISGTGTVTNSGTGIVSLGGPNSYSGETVLQLGTLKLGNGTALGAVSGGTTVNTGATLDFGGQNIATEQVTVSGAGVTNGGALINSGGDQQNAVQQVILTGDTSFGGSGRWDIRGTLASLSTAGNGFSLTKVGANQVSLVGVQVDAALGNINVLGGTFSVETSTTGLGNSASTVTVAPGATLQMFNSSVGLDKKFALNGNGTNSTVNIASGTGNVLVGPVSLTGSCIFNVGGGFELGVSGPVSGTGGLIKSGAGSLSLNGATTYGGDTVVNGGTLFLSGSASTASTTGFILGAGGTLDVSGLTGGPTLALSSGQTLQGNGTVNGSLSASASSVVSPGASIGVLTIANDIALGGTNLFEISKTAATNDRLRSVQGSITYGGVLIVTNLGGTITGGEAYKLFDSGSSSYSGAFTSIQLPLLGPGVAWNTSQLATSGILRVDGRLILPVFGGLSAAGGSFSFSGSGGTTNGTYYVLSSTNVAAPLATWESLATNTFDAFGNFSFSTPIVPGTPNRFFLLQALLP
jgi:autotransporter-associated beta strand protein